MQISNDMIRGLLEDFQLAILPDVRPRIVPRDLDIGGPIEPHIGNLIKVITGMRRCGKTFRLYQEAVRLLESGVDPNRILYFNFDDERLRPFPQDVVSLVVEAFFELHPEARSEGAYIFFDEVQEVDGWDLALRRIVDTEKVSMYLTGSSSKLLSEDVATEFRGRSVALELMPYSFKEYARAHGANVAGDGPPKGKQASSLLRNLFRSYLDEGGFPAVQGLSPMQRLQTLQSYVQFTVARDVVERQSFSNAAFARDLARIATASSARDFSINRVHNQSKGRGYSPGRERIAMLLDAFEDAHLMHAVYGFSRSSQRVRMGGFKLYSIDTGLFHAMSPATTDGATRALETAVYLELRRRRATGRLGEVSMLKLQSGREVDFVYGDEAFGSVYELVQVCMDVSDEKTRRREVAALDEAMEQFGLDTSTIVTLDEEDECKTGNGTIHIVPAWKWMLA